MNDLLIVFIGLALILFIFFTLGTARLAIQKSLNGLGLTLLSLFVFNASFFYRLLVCIDGDVELNKQVSKVML